MDWIAEGIVTLSQVSREKPVTDFLSADRGHNRLRWAQHVGIHQPMVRKVAWHPQSSGKSCPELNFIWCFTGFCPTLVGNPIGLFQ